MKNKADIKRQLLSTIEHHKNVNVVFSVHGKNDKWRILSKKAEWLSDWSDKKTHDSLVDKMKWNNVFNHKEFVNNFTYPTYMSLEESEIYIELVTSNVEENIDNDEFDENYIFNIREAGEDSATAINSIGKLGYDLKYLIKKASNFEQQSEEFKEIKRNIECIGEFLENIWDELEEVRNNYFENSYNGFSK